MGLLSFGMFEAMCMKAAGVASPTDVSPSAKLYCIVNNEDNCYYGPFLEEDEVYLSYDLEALEAKRREILKGHEDETPKAIWKPFGGIGLRPGFKNAAHAFETMQREHPGAADIQKTGEGRFTSYDFEIKDVEQFELYFEPLLVIKEVKADSEGLIMPLPF